MPKQATGTGIPVGLADDQVITGPAVPLTLERLAELRWLGRQLPAGPVFAPRVEHQGPGYRAAIGMDPHGQQDHILSRERGGHGRYGGQHDRNCGPHEWLVHRRRGRRRGGLARRQRPDQPGRKVGGDRGQVPMGPRGECLAHPRIQLGFAQHALHERGLEHIDHMLAIGMRRPQIPAGRVCCALVTRPCRHRYHPHLQNTKSLARQWGRSGSTAGGRVRE